MGSIHVDYRLDYDGLRFVATTGPHGVTRCRRLSARQWRRMARLLGRRLRVVEFSGDSFAVIFREG